MEIKVMGGGCANCRRLHENVKASVHQLGVDATIEYVTDYQAIMKAGLLVTPGLLFDGKVVTSGRVPTINEISELIRKWREKQPLK